MRQCSSETGQLGQREPLNPKPSPLYLPVAPWAPAALHRYIPIAKPSRHTAPTSPHALSSHHKCLLLSSALATPAPLIHTLESVLAPAVLPVAKQPHYPLPHLTPLAHQCLLPPCALATPAPPASSSSDILSLSPPAALPPPHPTVLNLPLPRAALRPRCPAPTAILNIRAVHPVTVCCTPATPPNRPILASASCRPAPWPPGILVVRAVTPVNTRHPIHP